MVFIEKKYLILFFLISFFVLEVNGQTQENQTSADTIYIDSVRKHSPTKATLMSMAVPGLGQVYNRQYWKVPVIYAGLGATVYFGLKNHSDYKRFKEAYIARIDDDASTVDEFDGILSDANVLSNMDASRRNRDFNFLIAGLVYVANLVDASVGAHLYTFPKDDKLTLDLRPSILLTDNNKVVNGFSLVLNL